ncbi:hypothetical protein D3C87_1270910 [compost metagenome]
MKFLISTVILLGSVNAFAFGTYSEEYNKLAAKRGYTDVTNYCEASAMLGQGAKGNLDLTIREYRNKKGQALTIVNYMINETAAEHYDMTDIIPLSITEAIKSKDVVGTRFEYLIEDEIYYAGQEEMEPVSEPVKEASVQPEEAYSPSHGTKTKGALAKMLLGFMDDEEIANVPNEKLELKRININKFTKNYDLNDDVFIECDSKI